MLGKVTDYFSITEKHIRQRNYNDPIAASMPASLRPQDVLKTSERDWPKTIPVYADIVLIWEQVLEARGIKPFRPGAGMHMTEQLPDPVVFSLIA